MADNGGTPSSLDFIVDKDNLYKEETLTDYKIATIRRLTPVKIDGSVDDSRQMIFFGSTQLTTPQGSGAHPGQAGSHLPGRGH